MSEQVICNNNNGVLTVRLNGRVDASNASAVEKEILSAHEAARDADIVIGAAELEYISSAGLRVIKRLYMAMTKKGGTLVLTNIRKMVMEVFEMTGFVGFLTIK